MAYLYIVRPRGYVAYRQLAFLTNVITLLYLVPFQSAERNAADLETIRASDDELCRSVLLFGTTILYQSSVSRVSYPQ